jgi:hypothetical protein
MGLQDLLNRSVPVFLSLGLFSSLDSGAEDRQYKNTFWSTPSTPYRSIKDCVEKENQEEPYKKTEWNPHDKKTGFSVSHDQEKLYVNTPNDPNTIEGFFNKSIDYINLDFENEIFYNNNLRYTQYGGDFKIGEKSLSILQRGFERALNETLLYRNAMDTSSSVAEFFAYPLIDNIAFPVLNIVGGNKFADKVLGDIDIDFNPVSLGGDPTDIYEPLTGEKRFDFEFDIDSITLNMGGDKTILRLEANELSLTLRDYPLFGGKISSSIRLKEESFSPFSAKFTFDAKFEASASINYVFEIGKMKSAIGFRHIQPFERANNTYVYFTASHNF